MNRLRWIYLLLAIATIGQPVMPYASAQPYQADKPISSPSASDSRLVAQVGHSSMIISVVFSPDSKFILTGGLDGTARLWEVETGNEVRKFAGPRGATFGVAFSPDSKYVLTGSIDQSSDPENTQWVIVKWKVESGKEVRRFAGKFEGHSGSDTFLTFSSDGKYVLIPSNVGDDSTSRLYDIENGKEIRKFEGHSHTVRTVTISPDGKYVLTGSGDKTARLWERESGKEIRRFAGHSDIVTSIAFSPDGKYVLMAGKDGKDEIARLYEVESGREVKSFVGDPESNSFG